MTLTIKESQSHMPKIGVSVHLKIEETYVLLVTDELCRQMQTQLGASFPCQDLSLAGGGARVLKGDPVLVTFLAIFGS